ncbi:MULTISPECIES: DUF2188 domain-containing protein [Cupriavidus]|uniref:DUF2188 domain-containing protein n=1 Tax=Cupriavidus TaxID=106589 RepID=UPI001AE176A5|nr:MULTISPECIES: DUF2188 domain-containing protein [unclassified Cupriavidus]MBP0619551.1 DUF2188 domain-containing protein [Cupriavidus sp. LEh25]MDK2656201.1 DUF2188 domain-containing protein [Cupriavidus sp. LEh21]
MGTSIHVVPHRDGWDVIHEGARYAESHHATQEEAIAAATTQAQREHVELLVHGRDGQIRSRNSFGHDPRTIPG